MTTPYFASSHFYFQQFESIKMKTSGKAVLNAKKAVAHIAYKTNEVFPIYPITPASEMSELVEQWNAEGKKNVFGSETSVFQMQSEGGVAGAMHGAIQTGSLSSTFTASQGLLLMLPNMYKIAGELTPNVIHVATRSIATHALSVFGDHSDVMAVRQSGYAMLASGSVQEAHDFALIAHTATLESSIPFVHFFDGFRTSHEINTISIIPDKTIKTLISKDNINLHRKRALNPNSPVLRGTTQGPDVYFQSREAINSFYDACPEIVQNIMNHFAKLTGRAYRLFDYVGHPNAERVVISLASSTETIERTILHLNKKGEKNGLIKVRLFRPFSTKHLLAALPKSVKTIAVLDRTKEPGASGEPLFLDVLHSITQAYQNNLIPTFPRIIGGRYGLSSKEFTPTTVDAIFKNLKSKSPKHNFTVGINDDVTNLSLDIPEGINIENKHYQAIFYHDKTDTKHFESILNLIGKRENTFVQGYTECNYAKSNTYDISHLRVSSTQIKAPYLIESADFIGIQKTNFILNLEIIRRLKYNGSLLVNTSKTSKAFWQSLSHDIQKLIISKNIELFTVNTDELETFSIRKDAIIDTFYSCFLSLKSKGIKFEFPIDYNEHIYKVDTLAITSKEKTFDFDNNYKESLLGQLLAHKGNEAPVSLMPADGTFETDTSKYKCATNSNYIPDWNIDLCTQCGACSMACPQAALRIKVYNDSYLIDAPKSFKHIVSKDFDEMQYSIQIHQDQCNGCNNCVDACSEQALSMTLKKETLADINNWNHFKTIPEFDRGKIDTSKVSEQQLQEPLFKYSNGVEGCGEAPYLKLMSQLFGDRLVIANATGASSIFGGALPTTPWAKNKNGRGPAWSNSLFEDNAEFGLGFRYSINQQQKHAQQLLKTLRPKLNKNLVDSILNAKQTNELDIEIQRKRIVKLNEELLNLNLDEANQLLNVLDNLIKKSVWIVGGDGWAYDIGFGGLDHVLASGENVNILVLDNEVYDNTGAQASKATPFGASSKFAHNSKRNQKKDLGLIAMTYQNVYVASVSIGADQEQTLKAFNEAESFDGPSLIIAYCHSDSHGIDMKQPSKHHKAAVNSGSWLLYRNYPRLKPSGLNTLQLDSKSPTIPIWEYLKLEKRFSKLMEYNPREFEQLIEYIQEATENKFQKYLNLSTQKTINTPSLSFN